MENLHFVSVQQQQQQRLYNKIHNIFRMLHDPFFTRHSLYLDEHHTCASTWGVKDYFPAGTFFLHSGVRKHAHGAEIKISRHLAAQKL